MYSYEDRLRAVRLYIKLGKRVAVTIRQLGYRWPGWLSRIADAKLVRSMSRKGYSPDNAACERFFGRLKTELFYSRNWLSTTIEEFVAAVDAYIRWYNEERIKMSLGFRSPIEHRRKIGLAA